MSSKHKQFKMADVIDTCMMQRAVTEFLTAETIVPQKLIGA
jgi:hypothetical protein